MKIAIICVWCYNEAQRHLTIQIERRLYYNSDYKGMRDYFTAINCIRILTQKSTQDPCDIFVKHFTYAIHRYIPITTKPILCNTKSWIDHNAKSQIKCNCKSFNKYYRNPTEENWKAYTIESMNYCIR